jgi:hypothetical protein
MKKLIKKIIDYLYRWSNTHLAEHMTCTFCPKTGMHTLTRNHRKKKMVLCDECRDIYKDGYRYGLKSSYWGGLGHK